MAWSDVITLYDAIKPIGLAILAIALYALFVFKFYRFLARRDILNVHLIDYAKSKVDELKNIFHGLLFLAEYVIIAPLLIFFWFLVLVLLLVLFTKHRDAEQIMLFALALVGAIRLVAYYSEDLAKDLGKTLPFSLLAVYLIDGAYVSLASSLALLRQLPTLWEVLLWYFGFVVLLEFVLRVISLALPRTAQEEDH